jgi:membrane protease YdiL (CAAX protease family)
MDALPLEEILKWDSRFAEPVAAVGTFTIAFFLYYFVMISPKVERIIRGSRNESNGQARFILFQRYWGGAVLGCSALALPFFFGKTPMDYGMIPGFSGSSLLISAALVVLVVVINIFRAGSAENLKHYPQIRAKEWDMKLYLQSSFGWIIYLLGYEWAFRGMLLYACVENLGIWPAIAVNTSLYAFAHLFKGAGETLGAIPFGIILCCITLHTGDFLVAFLVHCALAISNQTVALRAHPEMKWVKQRS